MNKEMEKEKGNESKETKAMPEGFLNEVRMPSITITNNKSKTEETHVPPIIPITSNSTLKRFNAASFIAGATIDISLSSSSSLSKTWFLDFDQSSLVLVDRPEPPANKAWCTSDKNPVLTVNLGSYIDPTAVSYQHSKWNGTIPDDAPREYSVEVSLQSQLNSIQNHIGKDFLNTKDEAEKGNENETEKTKATLEEGFKETRMKLDILSIHSQLNSFQKESNGKDFMNTKEEAEEENENEMERTKATLEDVLKEIRMESRVELKAIQSMINSTSHSEEAHAHVQQKVQAVVTNFTKNQYNAANLIAGAAIDASLSSSSSLNPFIGFDQSSLVLVDRPEPPVDKAWCTSDKNPVLTVNLGYYIKPTAVSYQHSKWNRILPDDAPKMYSVEFTYKTCSLLYSKGCCQECPECCEECDIKDINHDVLNEKVMVPIVYVAVMLFGCIVFFL
ncbi:hypothetical protein CAEBREN_15508 [Caenorhabditis brenneri]|uniref:SUN domain-containing protein n=1 Tax=Caenorhabditis brenneri TaxID=135651 RepID=G0MG31_CAEBE|nr:hypothetical protein CAEBREN_15508 [Caenorhabditis brenneri]